MIDRLTHLVQRSRRAFGRDLASFEDAMGVISLFAILLVGLTFSGTV